LTIENPTFSALGLNATQFFAICKTVMLERKT
jgi:hypothetical protein